MSRPFKRIESASDSILSFFRSPNLIIAFSIFFFGNALDIFTTQTIISMGIGSEANPIAATFLAESGFKGLWMLKILYVPALLLMISSFVSAIEKDEKHSFYALNKRYLNSFFTLLGVMMILVAVLNTGKMVLGYMYFMMM